MKYRADVDGLRAIAVLLVILFHAEISPFSGGYIGVDVFFVISGYLITKNILEDVKNDRFSLKRFYIRRARRIIPALLFVLSASYIISWFINLPAQHKVVGQYVVSSILSVSNILLYFKGEDYFGLEHGKNPLFHTWSLSVEEQFYLFYPLLLFYMLRVEKAKHLRWLMGLFCLSLVMAQIGSVLNPVANFYFTPARVWELLAGAIAAHIKIEKTSNRFKYLPVLGMALILVPSVFYDESIPSPSFFILLPVLGAVLIILFANCSVGVGKVLASKPLVLVGLASYSAYLWHIPLQVYGNYLFEESWRRTVLFFLALAILSWLTYKLIETPFRRSISVNVFAAFTVSSVVTLTLLGVTGHINNGHSFRTEFFGNLTNNNGYGLVCNGNTKIKSECSVSEEPNVAVLGNSFAMVWVRPLIDVKSVNLVQLTQDSCAVGYYDSYSDINAKPCANFYREAVNSILSSESIKVVLISSPFGKEVSSDGYRESLVQLLNELRSKRVYIVGPTPEAPFNVGECILKSKLFHFRDCDFAINRSHHEKISSILELIKNISHVEFIDITPYICPNEICSMNMGLDDSLYIDYGHLSRNGSSFILDKFFGRVENDFVR